MPGETYTMRLEVIGGPEKGSGNTGGFAMLTDAGILGAAEVMKT